jgi:hypothetical protein
MKLLPMRYREKQSEWFGQTGMSLHISHVVFANQSVSSLPATSTPSSTTFSSTNSTRVLEHHTFCHFVETCSQNGQTVVSIMRDLFLRLKRLKPNLKNVFVRSDNAGCYHGAEFILAVEQLYHDTGVLIKRIDYSEAQAGKSVCDRKSANVKGECRRHVNEGHNITNSSEFIEGAKSTKGLSISAAS